MTRPATPVPLRIAVVGAGALGSFIGARLAQAGHRVVLIGRAAHVAAILRDGLAVHGEGRVNRVALRARTELAAAHDADLVLVCVKSADTAAVALQLAPVLRAGAWVMSLQNGVANGATLAASLNQPLAIAAAYIAAALPGPGVVLHAGGRALVMGRLTAAGSAQADPLVPLSELAAVFTGAGFDVRLTDQPQQALWDKLIVNCACNAISGLAPSAYGAMAALPAIRELQVGLVREAVAVAQADGVPVSLDAALAATLRVAQAMPQQCSSTAQDLARGRPTEIDQLNGHIVQRGAALGVPVPLNHALWALVKLAEGQRRPAADPDVPAG